MKREDLEKLPELLKVSEVADYLRISRQHVYRSLLSRPDFPCTKISEKRTRISKEGFIRWLDNQL